MPPKVVPDPTPDDGDELAATPPRFNLGDLGSLEVWDPHQLAARSLVLGAACPTGHHEPDLV
ncbi:hypothetical protein [Streptomyces caatingaensis]|uniref:hypothetical protein n=1 Tax=Streptomyces caatingaensis TaxID=1678637 RepID=UPI0012FEC760|nr:hypothetical protein [Streptomyces caatingaensis]